MAKTTQKQLDRTKEYIANRVEIRTLQARIRKHNKQLEKFKKIVKNLPFIDSHVKGLKKKKKHIKPDA